MTTTIKIIMTLNIYTINHPLVKYWSSYIYNVKSPKNEKNHTINQIFLSLLYEITRKSIKSINLYIRKLESISEINLISKKRPYLIFSEIYLTQILGSNIYQFLPEAHIIPFQRIYHNTNEKIYINFNNLSKFFELNSHIVIIEQFLDLNSISNILNIITTKTPIIKEIQIICLICSNDVLQIINQNYTNINLTIYTTKIIENNNSQEMRYLLNTIFV